MDFFEDGDLLTRMATARRTFVPLAHIVRYLVSHRMVVCESCARVPPSHVCVAGVYVSWNRFNWHKLSGTCTLSTSSIAT